MKNLARRQRLQAVREAHDAWVDRYADRTPVADRPGSPDVGLHHLDYGASAEAEAEFQRAVASR